MLQRTSVLVSCRDHERASGHKLVIRYGTTPELIKMATSGVAFDLGVVPQDVWKDAAARAQVAPGPTPDVARVGLGIAVRSGAPKPDISTAPALKQTLLKAQSIASIPASATGTQLAGIYERLGITDEMKAKTKAQPAPKQIVEAVANGDARYDFLWRFCRGKVDEALRFGGGSRAVDTVAGMSR